MPIVTYVETNGSEHRVEVPEGETVMRAALNNDVLGIVGECGGGLACATCHCFVDESWVGRTGAPSGSELEMLECAAVPATSNSRLSCQIVMGPQLDGLIVHLPHRQF